MKALKSVVVESRVRTVTKISSRYLAVKPGQMPIHFRELTISETEELIAQEFLIYELKDIIT